MSKQKTAAIFVSALGLMAAAAVTVSAATVAYSGGTYSQNFDGLPNDSSVTYTLSGAGPIALSDAPINATGLTGWSIYKSAGTQANLEFRVQDGSVSGSGGRGAISFGTGTSTDRALGALPTSADIAGLGAVITNNTGQTLTQFTLSFTGEQWRRGDANVHDTLTFAYGLASSIDASGLSPDTNLDFASPNQDNTTVNVALDGNASANRAAHSDTVTGLSWAPGASMVVRWVGQDLSGQDDGLAIDDVSFSAPVPEPTSIGLLSLAAVSLRRRRR
jgi:hypothetical protein